MASSAKGDNIPCMHIGMSQWSGVMLYFLWNHLYPCPVKPPAFAFSTLPRCQQKYGDNGDKLVCIHNGLLIE